VATCRCGAPGKLNKVSKAGPTQGKEFWGCPKWKPDGKQHCAFFQWVQGDDFHTKKDLALKWEVRCCCSISLFRRTTCLSCPTRRSVWHLPARASNATHTCQARIQRLSYGRVSCELHVHGYGVLTRSRAFAGACAPHACLCVFLLPNSEKRRARSRPSSHNQVIGTLCPAVCRCLSPSLTLK